MKKLLLLLLLVLLGCSREVKLYTATIEVHYLTDSVTVKEYKLPPSVEFIPEWLTIDKEDGYNLIYYYNSADDVLIQEECLERDVISFKLLSYKLDTITYE